MFALKFPPFFQIIIQSLNQGASGTPTINGKELLLDGNTLRVVLITGDTFLVIPATALMYFCCNWHWQIQMCLAEKGFLIRVWSLYTMKLLPQLWSDWVVSLCMQRDDNHPVCVHVYVCVCYSSGWIFFHPCPKRSSCILNGGKESSTVCSNISARKTSRQKEKKM